MIGLVKKPAMAGDVVVVGDVVDVVDVESRYRRRASIRMTSGCALERRRWTSDRKS